MANYTRNQRLAEMLAEQDQAAAPVRGHTQGLAKMLRAGLSGYMQGKDKRNEAAAQKAMLDALAQPRGQAPQPMPAGVAGPPQMVQSSPYDAAIASQQGMGKNEYAQRNLANLLMQKQKYDLGQEDFEKQQIAREELAKLQASLNPGKAPVPGRDVPYSAAVQKQKVEAAAAGRPEWVQGIDPATNMPIQTNTKTGETKLMPTAKPMTGDQSNAALFADRMAASEEIISNAGPEVTDIEQKVLAGIPGVGNLVISPEYRKFDQAKRDFINATLRRESGAAIAASEFDNAEKQYFPQPGDDPQTIEQKKRNRQIAIKGIARAAGPTYQTPEPPNGKKDLSDDELVKKYGG